VAATDEAMLPDADRFETVLERVCQLADKTLPLAHYLSEPLDSVTARPGGAAPGLRPLP
jgi:hypothetical protein